LRRHCNLSLGTLLWRVWFQEQWALQRSKKMWQFLSVKYPRIYGQICERKVWSGLTPPCL